MFCLGCRMFGLIWSVGIPEGFRVNGETGGLKGKEMKGGCGQE